MKRVNGFSHTHQPPKEYCERCHTSFGSAEPRVAVALGKVMHEDCYLQHLHELKRATITAGYVH